METFRKTSASGVGWPARVTSRSGLRSCFEHSQRGAGNSCILRCQRIDDARFLRRRPAVIERSVTRAERLVSPQTSCGVPACAQIAHNARGIAGSPGVVGRPSIRGGFGGSGAGPAPKATGVAVLQRLASPHGLWMNNPRRPGCWRGRGRRRRRQETGITRRATYFNHLSRSV